MSAMTSAVSIETGVSLCFRVERACAPMEPYKILQTIDKISKHVKGIGHFIAFDLKNEEYHFRTVWPCDQ